MAYSPVNEVFWLSFWSEGVAVFREGPLCHRGKDLVEAPLGALNEGLLQGADTGSRLEDALDSDGIERLVAVGVGQRLVDVI